jgi:hypothetical protein
MMGYYCCQKCTQRRQDDVSNYAKHIAPLFAEAHTKGLWFYHIHTNLWFSPRELEAAQQEGKHRWAAASWQLRDPHERIAELDLRIALCQQERAAILATIYQEKVENLN